MSLPAERPIHCLSFDVEEHFQVSAFWSDARRAEWDRYESRVENNTRVLVELLAKYRAKATFFILGWVAERHPDMVKSLVAQGHEVASHGYSHELVTTQSPERFREDVRMAKEILEDLTGNSVVGYRAPSFSITADTEWALSILVEEGYQYDSSIYDRFTRGGEAKRSGEMFEIKTSAGNIWEVPPSTFKTLGVQLPVAGGGYFRLFPYSISRSLLRRLEAQGASLVIYLHPWEIDPSQPRMEGSWLSKFRHYLNLHKTQDRLNSLLADFHFDSIQKALVPIAGTVVNRAPGTSVYSDCPVVNRRIDSCPPSSLPAR
jgi:polysaccharide deacetylase family protein (PEP-CTERM system associated)